jgi:hypothetical protein
MKTTELSAKRLNAHCLVSWSKSKAKDKIEKNPNHLHFPFPGLEFMIFSVYYLFKILNRKTSYLSTLLFFFFFLPFTFF